MHYFYFFFKLKNFSLFELSSLVEFSIENIIDIIDKININIFNLNIIMFLNIK